MNEVDEEWVHLSFGPDYEDGEMIPRAELPAHALRGGGNIETEHPTSGETRWFEVWVVEG